VAPAQAKVAETSAMRAIVVESLLALIQRPAAIGPRECPETLLLDVQRLVAAQNELQRLSLVGASLLVAQMLLAAKSLPPSPAVSQNRECAPHLSSAHHLLPMTCESACMVLHMLAFCKSGPLWPHSTSSSYIFQDRLGAEAVDCRER